jgi:FKBP-type peptidyl-prolyl cis-trans isomerase
LKKYSFFFAVLLFAGSLRATPKDSTIYFNLPDSVRAVQFTTVITLHNVDINKNFRASIHAGGGIIFDQRKGRRRILYVGDERSHPKASGADVRNIGLGAYNFNYAWKENTPYKILISIASDSATQTFIHSGYIFLPEEKKWKFLGCRRETWYHDRIKSYSIFIRKRKKAISNLLTTNVWFQRSNSSWKNVSADTSAQPLINLYSHIDSTYQRQLEVIQIEDSIAAGKTNATKNHNGIYYTMLKEGTGSQVTVTDTVVAHYKGYLFSDGTIFDQTKDKPATFPLNRLIKGWQIGLPLCKVGGKIKLLIPSDLAYSIRTRAAKIPPNSILVFEIEVVDTNPSQ